MDSMNPETSGETVAATPTYGAPPLQSMIGEIQDRVGTLNLHVKDVIKQRPATCLLAAAGLGFLIARLARRRS